MARSFSRRVLASFWTVCRKATFKKGWWFCLLIFFTLMIGERSKYWKTGSTTEIDVVLLFTWLVLVALPLIDEIAFPGFSIRKAIDRASDQIVARIVASVNQSQVINFGQLPTSSAELEALRKEISSLGAAWIAAAETQSFNRVNLDGSEDGDSKDQLATEFLRYRLKLERVLSILAEVNGIAAGPAAHVPTLVQSLISLDVLPVVLSKPLMVFYSTCSAAIHGKELTPSQIAFVRGSERDLIRSLQAIAARG